MSSLEGSRIELAKQLHSVRIEGGAYCLPPRLLIRLSGRDAFRYLNGQVTRDLSRISETQALSACILTPKGKLCASLLIWRAGKDLMIECDPALEEALMARLERYIVADDVTLALDAPAITETIHVFGSTASGQYPGIHSQRLGVDGTDVQKEMMHESVTLIDPAVIGTLRIERGIPAWGLEMNEETLPPEVGLDLTHIDYDRGCYPGQETISRLKSIGRVRRQLLTLCSPAGCELRPEMRVINGENKEIGVISSAGEQFDAGAWVALAILPRETKEPLFAFDPLTEGTTALTIAKIHGS